jgi:hypothetical protein
VSGDEFNRVGAWHALGEFKLREAVWPEGAIALVVGGGTALYVVRSTTEAARIGIADDLLALGVGLLAVVFTALAIVVSLPSTGYLRMLAETPEGGMRRFLDPFLVAVGTQILIVLLSLAYKLLAGEVRDLFEAITFVVLGFLIVFGVLDIAALARQLVRHGMLRAADAVLEDRTEGREQVRRLPERRA